MDECPHTTRKYVRYTLSNGDWQLRTQCQTCFELSSRSWPRHQAPTELPDADLTRRDSFRRVVCDQQKLERQYVMAELYELRSAAHKEYLQSEAWLTIRFKVLKRENFLCEGCADREATIAHHVTYEHWGNELLWELKAVCDECHRKCHPDKND